jgi:hypothetical protein
MTGLFPAGISGSNALANAPTGAVTDFVKSQGGHTVITKVSTTSAVDHPTGI